MKYLVSKEALCTNCGQCEEICAAAYKKTKEKELSCIRIEAVSGQSPTIKVCNQCGVCIDICPVQAIYRDGKGVVRIKNEPCVGCYMCVGFCPTEAMGQHDAHPAPYKCIACGLCAKNCPTGAIFIAEETPKENQ